MTDEEIPQSEENRIPKILIIIFVSLFLWGLWAFYAYGNGCSGFLNRGCWAKLQKAAGTTFENRESAK